jgi:hypothetical protein
MESSLLLLATNPIMFYQELILNLVIFNKEIALFLDPISEMNLSNYLMTDLDCLAVSARKTHATVASEYCMLLVPFWTSKALSLGK